ncbi:hypothetical protein Tco_1281833 [Tanacetum coccineum]
MEDDTADGGFHVESPVGPDDAPTPTADAAGRAEDPTLLTSLSAKLDRCMGRIDSLETELGTTKKIMGGAILTLVSRVKKLERTVKQLRTARLVGDAPAAEGDVDIQDDVDIDGLSRMASAALGHDQPTVPSEDVEEREEEEVPLRRKRTVYRRARTEFNTPAFEQFQAPLSADVLPHTAVSESAGPSVAADKGKAPMPDLDIPAEFLAEDAQARQCFEEEQQFHPQSQILVESRFSVPDKKQSSKKPRLAVKRCFFSMEKLEERSVVTQPKGYEDPYIPKHVTSGIALFMWMTSFLDPPIKPGVQKFEVLMKGEFEMSAMGEMTFFLGLQTSSYSTDFSSECSQEDIQVSKRATKIRLVCKKQTIMATSSTEAEYVAAASCCAQVLWIQNQLLDYGFNFMNTKIFIDNQSTICIVKNPVFHQRTKHIEIRHHFIRDANEKNLIQVLKIHTDDNVADLLTKAFDGPRFEYLVVHIGMVVNTAASCTFFLLTGWFLLVVLCFCWHTSAGGFISADRFDIAGWLVSATSHLVSAGRLQSCWCNNVSAECIVCAAHMLILLLDLFLLVLRVVTDG